jgi:EAL domain-containing protein (putative c-di-GMP-specific phosphodiesterase class I)/PAS domain-containing protein
MSRMFKGLRRTPRRKTLMLGSIFLLALALVAAIFFAQAEVQWLAFFGGVVLAAFSVLATQAARTEWVIKRRTKQLERMRDRLDDQTARGDVATDALRAARARLTLLNDEMPVPVLYFDIEQRCRYHNPASRRWLGLTFDRIEGHLFSDIVGGAIYAEINPHIPQTLAGKTVEYEFVWNREGGEAETVKVRQIPWAPNSSVVVGFYLIATSWATPPGPAPQAEKQVWEPLESMTDARHRALYLRSITEDIMGEVDDPRAKLKHAMEKDEFLLFVQKIQPIAPGENKDCYEILLRLKEEEDNLLPPGGFIPIAERYGMLSQLDLWVVNRLIRWCSDQRQAAAGWQAPIFCINLSETSILNATYAQSVKEALARTQFPGGVLCFEIGEPEALNHHPEVASLIETLKPAGCRFTIDAFGSNRVSFTYLRGLPIDFVKIDGNIVHNIVRDPGELAKARAIHRVCHTIGVKTIAESVEQEETLNLLRDIGIDYVQGFGIAAPAPIAMLAAATATESAS